jgi:hypothetical protein
MGLNTDYRVKTFGRISKTIFKNKEFTVKHVICPIKYGKTNNDTKTSPIVPSVFINEYEDKFSKDKINAINIDTDKECFISFTPGFKVQDPSMQSVVKPNNIYANVLEKDFYKLLKSLNLCKDWLLEEKYEHLFTKDEKGNTIDVSDKTICTAVRLTSEINLIFRPVVIFQDINYQGIVIYINEELLGRVIGEQFLQLHRVLKEIMDNFYNVSLSLWNFAFNATYNTKDNKFNNNAPSEVRESIF